MIRRRQDVEEYICFLISRLPPPCLQVKVELDQVLQHLAGIQHQLVGLHLRLADLTQYVHHLQRDRLPPHLLLLHSQATILIMRIPHQQVKVVLSV